MHVGTGVYPTISTAAPKVVRFGRFKCRDLACPIVRGLGTVVNNIDLFSYIRYSQVFRPDGVLRTKPYSSGERACAEQVVNVFIHAITQWTIGVPCNIPKTQFYPEREPRVGRRDIDTHPLQKKCREKQELSSPMERIPYP
ncbi:hypothetical protein GOBAR_DD26767 [Gossypium barbadense]|nr:hypothetical protein GOBAR_DD26767 [Gossypium barbadense]